MKKGKIILLLLILILSLTYFVYSQLFKQPKLVEGSYVELKDTFAHHSGDVWEVKFASNDTLMVSGGIDPNTKIWNRITGELVHNLPHETGSPAVDFNPNGKLVATGAYDGKVRLWNVTSGKLLKALDGKEGTVWSVDFSPKGDLIAAGGDDDIVTIWDVNSGVIKYEFKEASHNIWEVVFNPTGEYLASSGSDNAIRIYDVKTGRLIKTILGHSLVPLSMDFSPNGKLLASGSDDKTVKIWDTNTWELLHTLKGENEAIHSVLFIGNNKILAGGTDKKILGELLEYNFGFTGYTTPLIATLWDIEKEEILQTITEHENDLGIGCDVSSDGKWLATSSADKTVKLWEISTENVVDTESVKADENIKQRIDDYLTKGVSNGLSGAVLVYKEGKILLNKGYGFADKKNETLNTPNTVFDIGSVSKQFTAAAIIKLEEQGKLRVEDSLSKFFKNLPEDKKNITIHQLLIHSAGIIRGIGKSDFDIISTEDYFNELFSTTLTHEPGTKHEYSNAGYSILSRIIELVSKQSHESFINQYLFKPAGMKHTGYLLPKWDDMSIAIGYSYNVMNIGTMIERYKKDNTVSWVIMGNGGIHSTQEDMYKWYQALKSNKVLSNATVKKMTKPYILEFEGETSYYSYGWVVFQSPRNTKMVAHDGSNGTFFYDYRWFPEEDVLIIYGTNAFTTKIGGIGWWVDKMLFDETYTPKPIEPDFVSSVLEYSEKFNGSLAELKSKIIEEFGSEITKPFYLNRLSGLYSRNYMFDKAILFAELNIELFPNDSNLWDSLGQAYYNKGNIKKALVAFREAVALDANNSYAQEMIKKLTN